MKNNLVKLEDGYFRTDRNILLTDKGLETFFAEDMDVIVRKEENISNLTRPDTIPDKKLFFNDSENKELEFLTGTLKDTNFHRVRERLKKSSMMTGFTVLFYGVPGTGKTESVYQLARSTGRGILRVNISETKDMWYGESEKRVKEIFDSYRKICRKSEQIPILLFNEADGILGKRRELSHSGVAQTENAIQNILLQEMEEFEGILIATTNLTVNLDKAFERRFLYKIKFNNPGFEAKVKIWKSKIPRLHVDRAKMLAQEYNLTGGQIENVARKFTTEEIMTGNRPGLDRIREFCKEEKLDRGEKRRIGY